MKLIRQLWDFLFGVIVVGATPVIALVALSFALSFIFPRSLDSIFQKIAYAVSMASSLVVPMASLWFVVRWRKRHRLLPVSMLWVEVPVGLVASAAFYFFVAAMWFFSDPNW
jgi:hypothetical protein